MSNTQPVGDEIPEGCELIEVHVTELRLLFNAIDPSPPRERDLDPKADEFIVGWARAAPRDARLALQVDVDRPGVPDEVDAVRDAVHHHFADRAANAQRRLTQLFRDGRTSLLIGVTFLFAAVLLGGAAVRAFGPTPVSSLFRESMIIAGWVAMWRPLQIFLYDWWPIRAERRLYDRLSVMPTRVDFTTATSDAGAAKEERLPARAASWSVIGRRIGAPFAVGTKRTRLTLTAAASAAHASTEFR